MSHWLDHEVEALRVYLVLYEYEWSSFVLVRRPILWGNPVTAYEIFP